MARRLSIMFLVFICTFIMGAAAVYADTNVELTDDTTLDRIADEGNVTITTTGDYTLTVTNGIDAGGIVMIEGARVFVKNYGIVASGNIFIQDKAFVNSYSKEVVDHYGPRAISSKNGMVVVTDSVVEAEISDGGSHVIYAANGFTARNCQLTLKTGDNCSCGISTYNNGAGINMADCAISATICDGDGLSAYRGDVYLERVFGIFDTGSEGISGYEKVELLNCDITIDGGKDEPGAGEPPCGMFAFGTIAVKGGKLKSKSALNDGIYANDEVSISADTEYVEAEGSRYAIRVGSAGKITLASGLTFVDPVGGKVPEGYKVITDKNGNAVSKVILKGGSAPVTKKTNPLKAKGKTYKVKYKTLKKKTVSTKVSNVIKFYNKGQGTLTYKKTRGTKKISVNKKTGKVTIKKGLKKGKYTIKIKVTAKGNSKYKSKYVTVTSKIVVK